MATRLFAQAGWFASSAMMCETPQRKLLCSVRLPRARQLHRPAGQCIQLSLRGLTTSVSSTRLQGHIPLLQREGDSLEHTRKFVCGEGATWRTTPSPTTTPLPLM